MNSILAIHPYKVEGIWVFDDPAVGLRQEPFVAGADTIIEHLAASIPNADRGFTILFSAGPFPGSQVELEWRRSEMGGNWYYTKGLDVEGWLCPALYKYFEVAPERIFLQFRAKP